VTTADRRDRLTSMPRDDDRRQREELKHYALQTQLDELRQLLRELASRQLRLEEKQTASDAELAEVRQGLEQVRRDISQAAQARQLEDARIRQQLVELATRLDEATRPVRALQAHVAELAEALRRQRDEAGQDTRRYDELRVLIDHLSGHIERLHAISQSVRTTLDTLSAEVQRIDREVARTQDNIRIVDQEARRRVAEGMQGIDKIQQELKELHARQQVAQARIEEIIDSIKGFDPQIEDLAGQIEQVRQRIPQVEERALERHTLVSERLEELRQQLEAHLRDVSALAEQRHAYLLAQLEVLGAEDRNLAYRLDLFELRLEELREIDRQLRSELWRLHEQRARLRLEQAQQELEAVLEARKQADKEQGTQD